MAVQHVIPELDRKGLRNFGLVTGAIVAGLFGVAIPWLFERDWPLWPWAVLVVLAAVALAVPEALRPVYKYWMKFGLLASKVTTPLLMGAVFFLIFAPMAIVRRMLGRDSLSRSFDESASTYRVLSERKPARTMERPY